MTLEECLELVITHLRATTGREAIKRRQDPSMTGEHHLLEGLNRAFRAIAMLTTLRELNGLRILKANLNSLVAFNLIREADWTQISFSEACSL